MLTWKARVQHLSKVFGPPGGFLDGKIVMFVVMPIDNDVLILTMMSMSMMELQVAMVKMRLIKAIMLMRNPANKTG